MKKSLSLVLCFALAFGSFFPSAHATTSLTVPFRPSDIPTGLVGYWTLNNTPNDSSGKGYNLTGVNSPAYIAEDYWADGEYSTDLVPASNHRYTRARNADLDLLDAFTIAFWMKADDITSVQVVDKDQAGNGYGVSIDASSKIILNLNNGARATSATAVVIGKWTHVVCVYSQTTANIYIDGNLDISSAYSTDAADAAVDLTIGALGDGTLDWDGHLKDLAMWSAALTPLQIKSLALGIDLGTYAYRPSNVANQPTHWLKGTSLVETMGGWTWTNNGTTPLGGGYIEGENWSTLIASSRYLSHADSADVDFSGGVWAVKTRIKTTTLVAAQTVWSQGDDNSNLVQLNLATTGILTLNVRKASATPIVIVTTGAVISANAYYDIVCLENGDTWKIYVDGVDTSAAVTGSTGVTGRIGNFAGDFQIGACTALTTDIFSTMTFEDFSIWLTNLPTATEIASLACALPIQQQGIVSYWKLNEQSGTRADSLTGNTLTDGNTVLYDTGKVGNAALYNAAASEYLEITDANQVNLEMGTTEYTAMMWVYPHTVAPAISELMGKTNATGEAGFILKGAYFGCIDNGDYRATGATAVAINAWTHGVSTWDGPTRKVYRNAVMDNSGAYATAVANSAYAFRLGITVSGNYPFDGLMDEALFAIRYFRPEEIKAVYLKGLNGKEATSTENEPAPQGKHRMFNVF